MKKISSQLFAVVVMALSVQSVANAVNLACSPKSEPGSATYSFRFDSQRSFQGVTIEPHISGEAQPATRLDESQSEPVMGKWPLGGYIARNEKGDVVSLALTAEGGPIVGTGIEKSFTGYLFEARPLVSAWEAVCYEVE